MEAEKQRLIDSMEAEKQKISNLMFKAYNMGMDDTISPSVRIEAMKAYASLSLSLHNMKYY